jgi:hypothetical protein
MLGNDIINAEISQVIKTTVSSLTQSTVVKLPCRLETGVDETQKVNQWIKELNSIT